MIGEKDGDVRFGTVTNSGGWIETGWILSRKRYGKAMKAKKTLYSVSLVFETLPLPRRKNI